MKKNAFSVSEFKSKALGLLEQVAKSGESFIVTKRGKPIARVIPFQERTEKPVPGRLKDVLISEEDIVSPLGSELWQAAES